MATSSKNSTEVVGSNSCNDLTNLLVRINAKFGRWNSPVFIMATLRVGRTGNRVSFPGRQTRLFVNMSKLAEWPTTMSDR